MKLTYAETARLCRELGQLQHAGISLGDGIHLLSQQESGERKPLLALLGGKMDAGMPLSEAMEAAQVFPPLVTGMTRIGENTGRLEEALNALGEYYEDLLRQDGIKVNWTYAKLFNRGLSMRCRFFSFIFVLYAKLRIIWYIKKSKSTVVISFLELSNRLNCISKLISNHTVITGERNAIMPLSSSASWIYYKLLMKLYILYTERRAK